MAVPLPKGSRLSPETRERLLAVLHRLPDQDMLTICEALGEVRRSSRPDIPPLRFRHLKRGSTYKLVRLTASLQTGVVLKDGDAMVVYESENGDTWVRPSTEFFDGRFEEVKE